MSIEIKKMIYGLKKKNLIIFTLVSFIALQNLIFQITFRLNFPYSVDFTDIFTPMFNFIVKNEFSFFINKGLHVMFFPKLISFPNLYLNSFDVVNLTYVYWIVISLTVFIMYLIIKQTDKKLIWTLIPIAAFLYSPLTSSGYFMLSMLPWYFPMLGITLIIYLFNRNTTNSKIFASSTSLAIFSTFSILLGVVSWIAGLVMLFKLNSQKQLENKKWILLWITSSTIIGICYLTLTSGFSEETRVDLLFSYTGFSFIANFLSSSFRLKFEFLMIIVGTFSIILSFIYGWYFLKKNYFKQYFPWFVFLFSAFCGSIITALGRMQLENHLGNEPYYSTISQFFQIGLIVLTGKIILDFKINPKTLRKKIIVIIMILLLISQMVLLIPSYYSGWQRGEYYFQEKTEYVNCFSSNPNLGCLDFYYTQTPEFLSMINYLIENKLSIFNESNGVSTNNILYKEFGLLENLPVITYQNNFQILNDNDPVDVSIYNLDDEIIQISGWFTVPIDSPPNTLFLLINEKPMIKNNNFQIISEPNDNSEKIKIEWSVFFLSGYLETGCNSIQLIGESDRNKILLDNEFEICK